MTELEIVVIVVIVVVLIAGYDLIKYTLHKLFNIGLYKGPKGCPGQMGCSGPQGPMGEDGKHPSKQYLKVLIKEVIEEE